MVAWTDIFTGTDIVWLNDLGDVIPWINDSGIIIPWYSEVAQLLQVVWINGLSLAVSWVNGSGDTVIWGGIAGYTWQQIPTPQQPYWGALILTWENNSNVILGWSNTAGTQLKWRSKQFSPQPVKEPNAFWTVVPT